MLREIFGRDMDSRDAEVQTRIAQKLLKQANDPNNDATSRYVALHQAAVFAARSGDAPTAMSALDQMEKQYRAQTAAIRLQVLAHAQRAARAPEEHAQVAQSFANLVFVAISEDDFEVANQAVRNATSSGSRSRNRDLITQLRQLTPLVRDAEQRYRAVRVAFGTLESNPDDPQANLAVGRYLCFVKADWDAGLPHLARGGDTGLSAAAQTDLANPSQEESMIALADAWYDLSEKEDEEQAKAALLLRAGQYYAKALPTLGGFAKARAERRIEEAEKAGIATAQALPSIIIQPAAVVPTESFISSPSGHYGGEHADRRSTLSEGNYWDERHRGKQIMWQLQLVEPVILTRYRLVVKGWSRDANHHPHAWVFKGSKDGQTWVELDKKEFEASPLLDAEVSPGNAKRTDFEFENTEPYHYFRFVFEPTKNDYYGGVFSVRVDLPEINLRDIPVKNPDAEE